MTKTPQSAERAPVSGADEREPCPFCGNLKLHFTSNGAETNFVECVTCGASGPAEAHERKAVIAWNRRASLCAAQVPALSIKKSEWEVLSPEAQAKLLAITGAGARNLQRSQAAADIARVPLCSQPPEGWTCSRGEGHDGPCASSPAGAAQVPSLSETRLQAAVDAIAAIVPRQEESVHGPHYRCQHCGYAWLVNDPDDERHLMDCAYVIATSVPHHPPAALSQPPAAGSAVAEPVSRRMTLEEADREADADNYEIDGMGS